MHAEVLPNNSARYKCRDTDLLGCLGSLHDLSSRFVRSRCVPRPSCSDIREHCQGTDSRHLSNCRRFSVALDEISSSSRQKRMKPPLRGEEMEPGQVVGQVSRFAYKTKGTEASRAPMETLGSTDKRCSNQWVTKIMNTGPRHAHGVGRKTDQEDSKTST